MTRWRLLLPRCSTRSNE